MESSRFGRRHDRRRRDTRKRECPRRETTRMLRYLRLMVLDSHLSSRLLVEWPFRSIALSFIYNLLLHRLYGCLFSIGVVPLPPFLAWG